MDTRVVFEVHLISGKSDCGAGILLNATSQVMVSRSLPRDVSFLSRRPIMRVKHQTCLPNRKSLVRIEAPASGRLAIRNRAKNALNQAPMIL